MRTIPVFQKSPAFTVDVLLESIPITLEFIYRPYGWYVSAFDEAGSVIYRSSRLSPNTIVFPTTNNRMPPGTFACFGIEDYTQEDLGSKLRLVYYDLGELVDLLPVEAEVTSEPEVVYAGDLYAGDRMFGGNLQISLEMFKPLVPSGFTFETLLQDQTIYNYAFGTHFIVFGQHTIKDYLTTMSTDEDPSSAEDVWLKTTEASYLPVGTSMYAADWPLLSGASNATIYDNFDMLFPFALMANAQTFDLTPSPAISFAMAWHPDSISETGSFCILGDVELGLDQGTGSILVIGSITETIDLDLDWSERHVISMVYQDAVARLWVDGVEVESEALDGYDPAGRFSIGGVDDLPAYAIFATFASTDISNMNAEDLVFQHMTMSHSLVHTIDPRIL